MFYVIREASLGYEDLKKWLNLNIFILDWKKEMATHSSILASRISWTEEPGVLKSMGSQGVGHDLVTTYTY